MRRSALSVSNTPAIPPSGLLSAGHVVHAMLGMQRCHLVMAWGSLAFTTCVDSRDASWWKALPGYVAVLSTSQICKASFCGPLRGTLSDLLRALNLWVFFYPVHPLY